jgi:hypothetical protein
MSPTARPTLRGPRHRRIPEPIGNHEGVHRDLSLDPRSDEYLVRNQAVSIKKGDRHQIKGLTPTSRALNDTFACT